MIKSILALYALFITSQIIAICMYHSPATINKNFITFVRNTKNNQEKKAISAIYFHTDCYSYTPMFIIQQDTQDKVESADYSCLITF